MSIQPIRLAARAALAVFLFVPAAAAQQDDPVVALVNGDAIHRSDLETAQQFLPAQFQSMPLEAIFGQLLDRVIEARLVTGEARKSGLREDEEVKKRLAEIEDRVLQDVFIQRFLADKLTEQALRQRYEAIAPALTRPEEVRARHILVETEAEAREIIAEIKAGADFSEMAKARSTGPSAPDGGDIGYATRDGLVAPFADVAFALEPGQMADEPVKTQFGWHVIKVEDKRTAPPPSFDDMREGISRQIQQNAVAELLARLVGDAEVERFNLDGSPQETE